MQFYMFSLMQVSFSFVLFLLAPEVFPQVINVTALTSKSIYVEWQVICHVFEISQGGFQLTSNVICVCFGFASLHCVTG